MAGMEPLSPGAESLRSGGTSAAKPFGEIAAGDTGAGSADILGDPVFDLRSKQWSEYQKLCLELRLKCNSAIASILKMEDSGGPLKLPPPKQEVKDAGPIMEVSCPCGNKFAQDAVFCRKCGRAREAISKPDPGETAAGTWQCCGNTFASDQIFCKLCGRPRADDKELEDEAKSDDDHPHPHAVHEYDFTRLYLGDRQIQPLAGALAMDHQIVALYLPGCGIRDPGMVSLCEQLKRSPSLECIDISSNRFSIGGCVSCLRLVAGAQRLVLLKHEDTCLEEDFCNKRGLLGKYAKVRKDIQEVLMNRALSMQ